MYKLAYWILKIIAVALLIVPVLLFIPGFIVHILSEEFDEKVGS